MMRAGRVIVASLPAIAIGVASLPLGVLSANSFFGLGSVLLVPAVAIGAVRALWTSDRQRRAWCFGFAVAAGLCFPLAAAIEKSLHDFAAHWQSGQQRLLSTDIVELGCLLSIVFAPVAAACLAGLVAGGLMRRLVRRAARVESAASPDGARWQFSLRELLVALGAVGALLAWNSRFTTDRQASERQKQQPFLARFKVSFRSGEIKLLAEPAIAERQGAIFSPGSFKPPGINEYRLTAPIEKQGERRWAVWAFTSNENAGEMIYQYAYAEAELEAELPQSPLPRKRYIEATWQLIDGTPATVGPSAAIVSIATPSRVGQPVVLTARSPAGTVCELGVFPRTEATALLGEESPDKNGLVRWSWTPDPAIPVLQYELRCIMNRPSGRTTTSLRGSITVGPTPSR